MISIGRLTPSVQSMIGATEIRRSGSSRGGSASAPILADVSDSGTSAGIMGIPGSLRLRRRRIGDQIGLSPPRHIMATIKAHRQANGAIRHTAIVRKRVAAKQTGALESLERHALGKLNALNLTVTTRAVRGRTGGAGGAGSRARESSRPRYARDPWRRSTALSRKGPGESAGWHVATAYC